jgi:putative membrane protein (TIGR04086 family)
MGRNPILLGLAAAAIAFLIIKLVKITLGSLLADFMLEAIYNLPWLAGGFVTGYKSKSSPLKNGAIAGAFYGAIFCLIGIVLISSQTYGVQEKISQLGFAAVATIRFAFMFSLASAFGYLQKPPHTAL